jgi:multidrug efflux pump subunit AcrA (membrane-fusion protein)
MNNRFFNIAQSLLLLFLMLSSPSCRKEQDEAQGEDAHPEVKADVRVTQIRAGLFDETTRATGVTSIRKEAQIRSPLTGIIVRFPFFNGDSIKAGMTIAEVRSKESQASMQGAESLLRSADNERAKEEAEKAVALAKKMASAVQIQAPFTGILSAKTKNEMEVVSEGDQIASLVDPSSVFFVADVPGSSVRQIHIGNAVVVRFSSRPGKLYEGKVYRIEPQANPNDQTIHVQIVFTRQYGDLEGSLFGEVSIKTGGKKNVLCVPERAILHDDEHNASSVMTVGSDSIAVRVPVTTGLRSDSLVQISSPAIIAGENVLVEGHYGLPDSTKVRIVP